MSTGSIFARLADAPALVTAAYRVGLASLVILPLAAWKAGDELRNLSFRDVKMAVLSGLFLALHFATWISSLDYTAIANSVVLVNTIPLWVGLFTPLITKDRLARATVISIIISVVGAAIIGFGDFATGGRALLGDLLAVIGAIAPRSTCYWVAICAANFLYCHMWPYATAVLRCFYGWLSLFCNYRLPDTIPKPLQLSGPWP